MDMRPYPKDAQFSARFFAQRVLNGFREGRKIIRRIVVDEQDLIVFIMQDFRHAIETERRALVKVVAVIVVAAVKNN